MTLPRPLSLLLNATLLIAALLVGSQARADGEAVQTTAVIESVMLSKQMLKITHGPVAAWGWPSMKMKFAVAPEIDLKQLNKGANVTVTLQKGSDGKAIITAVE